MATETRTTEQHSTLARVNIQLRDINDNSPRFAQTSYTTSVLENRDVGYPIRTITVSLSYSGPHLPLTCPTCPACPTTNPSLSHISILSPLTFSISMPSPPSHTFLFSPPWPFPFLCLPLPLTHCYSLSPDLVIITLSPFSSFEKRGVGYHIRTITVSIPSCGLHLPLSPFPYPPLPFSLHHPLSLPHFSTLSPIPLPSRGNPVSPTSLLCHSLFTTTSSPYFLVNSKNTETLKLALSKLSSRRHFLGSR